MSVPVSLDDLPSTLAERGLRCFLITVGDDRPHVVSATVTWDGQRLRAPAGRRTRSNVIDRPEVTLLWPAPPDDPTLSLLVDGTATVVEGTESIIVSPIGAVLHRSPPPVE